LPYTNCYYLFASDFVISLVITRLMKKNKQKLASFIESSENVGIMASLRGQIFERIPHVQICQGNHYQVRCLSNNDDDGDSSQNDVCFGVLEEKMIRNIE